MTLLANYECEIVIRILIASVLGIMLGIQREYRKTIEKTVGMAGLRTHTIVALSTALITSIGALAFSTDPVRLAASILTGIGFIGAGTIIATGDKIKGLVNATTIWISATIGIAAGFGFYIAALLTTIIAILVLELKKFEKID